MILLPPTSTLFPYTTLFRSLPELARPADGAGDDDAAAAATDDLFLSGAAAEALLRAARAAVGGGGRGSHGRQDRKSTRLNSSHQIISYAVFCLKKKIKSIIR